MRRQHITVQEFKHYNNIPSVIDKSSSRCRLIHYTTTIRTDNSAVMVLLWEEC